MNLVLQSSLSLLKSGKEQFFVPSQLLSFKKIPLRDQYTISLFHVMYPWYDKILAAQHFWTKSLKSSSNYLLVLTGTDEQQYKANEAGNSPVNGQFCGEQIKYLYDTLCDSEKRKRSKLKTNLILSWLKTLNQNRKSE